jgi:HEAT repeat protein
MDSSSSQADPILLLIDKLRTEKGPGRVEVLRQLQELNPVPQEVMSELIRVLKDQDPVVRLEAAMFFEDVGPSAVPMLVEALQGGEVELRRAAAATLGIVGPDAQAAVPALKRARRDEAIGPEATEALRKIKYYTSWVREVEKSFEQAMPAVLLIVVTLVLGLLMYQLFGQAKPVVYNLALSFG